MSEPCPHCRHENPPGSRFCEECGAAFGVRCPGCGAEISASARFCNQCGSAREPRGRAAAPERDPRDYTPKHLADKILQSKSALEGERKQVTVLFADVKGSLELSAQIDAEEWHRILERFFQILADGVHRFEGTVNQYTGDGIMALFGAPIAHEDHAQRACYTALHLRDALRSYADELRRSEGLSFSVRMGVNSGEVVVGKIGDDLRMDYTAQGHTVGLAARIQQIAAPDRVYLSEHSAGLVEGFFRLRDLGPFELKGTAEPVRIHDLEGAGAARTRLEAARSRGFSKFVGRNREIAMLEEAYEQAASGRGQVVGVVADAGTGKSRLCFEFVELCRARGILVNEAHCPAHGKTVPFLPLLELLRHFFGIRERDSDREARRKIAGELMLLDQDFRELLPLVFEFLGVPDPERPAPRINPEARQRQLLAFVRHLVQARSAREPAVMLLDDLHWIDPGSDEFLAQAVEAAGGTRTLVLVNFRPEYRADWMSKSYYRQIPLSPLGPEATRELLLDLLGGDPSLASLPDRIQERTGGNPFFTEEVVQSLIESGSLEGARGAYRLTGPIEALEMPATVQSVLAARIDRLAEREKQLLQTASVIGKEFSGPVLKRVAELPEGDLAEALRLLERAEFIFEKALYPEAEYAFKHPLTQEVALHSQLSERRKRMHAAVASAIEKLDAERLDERAALLAYHWEMAGKPLDAARWHTRAARWCGFESPPDALRHWQRVRELLRALPESAEATRMRLDAATEILNFGWQHGLGEGDAAAIFAEGKELASRSGDAHSQALLLTNFAATYNLGGSPEAARSPGQEALALAEDSGDPKLRYLACDALADTCFHTGQLEAAVRWLDELIRIGVAELRTEIDPRGLPVRWYYAYRALFQTYMGRLAAAAESLRKAEPALRRLDHAQPLSWYYAVTALHRAHSGDPAAALSQARRAADLAERVGTSTTLVMAYESHGLALAENGEFEAAASRYQHALEIARGTRAFLSLEAEILSGLAESWLGMGAAERARQTAAEAVGAGAARGTPVGEAQAQLALARALLSCEGEKARSAIDSALARCLELVEQTGARLYEPQIHEVRAELARVLGDDATGERELREARRLFSEMGATERAERVARDLAQ